MADDPKDQYKVETQYGFRVFANESGGITIEQDDPFADPQQPPMVAVGYEQVDALIGFLQTIKEQLRTERADQAQAENLRVT